MVDPSPPLPEETPASDGVVQVRLGATSQDHDAVRALGIAIDAPLCGDEISVQQQLERLAPEEIHILGAHLAPRAAEHLQSLAPWLRWTLQEGTPAPADDPPTDEEIERAFRERRVWVRDLAQDGTDPATHEDLLFLQLAARRVVEPQEAALAGSAAVRLLVRYFQPTQGLSLAREILQDRGVSALPHARGLLCWAEADALLSQGAEGQSQRSHALAVEALTEAGSHDALLVLARSCAARWAQRGSDARAREWLDTTRALLATHPDPLAQADALRISAELSARLGEKVRASTLFEEASESLRRSPRGAPLLAMVRVGQAGLAMGAEDPQRCQALLEEADLLEVEDSLVLGHLAFRWAELSIRMGELDASLAWEERARQHYRCVGSQGGLILCARHHGDLAALRGDPLGASEAWRRATGLCLRSRNLALLRPVLERLLTLESEGEPGPHLDTIRQTLELARALS